MPYQKGDKVRWTRAHTLSDPSVTSEDVAVVVNGNYYGDSLPLNDNTEYWFVADIRFINHSRHSLVYARELQPVTD